ncbi:MAG: hypothetical protein IJ124_14160 [Clostridia bacterium]|nr:hypothetical protein [Clostridia bacterium]
MAERMQRKMMAHYIDSTFGGETPDWYRLGKDLEEFNVELNPDVEQFKNILGENNINHNGYEVSADSEPFYARTGDALFAKLQGIVDTLAQYEGCQTEAVEVHLWEAGTAQGSFVAYRQTCYVIPSSYGGDTSGYQIPFTVYYTGEKVKGSFVPNAAGGGTFTADT